MNPIEEIKKAISDNIAVKQLLLSPSYLKIILIIADQIYQSLKKGKKLLICGNGGSAADSQHIAAELICRYKMNRKPLPAIALTTDTSVLTSISNDFSYDEVFKKQIEALGKKGDTLLAISTSGNSKNVLAAVAAAKKKGLKTIGFTGHRPSRLSKAVDYAFKVPSDEVARIQESHLLAIHIISDLLEKRLCTGG